MNINSWGKLRVYIALGIIMAMSFLYYLYFINFNFVASTGDNYTYELLAQSLFTSKPFMVNAKFDYYDEHPILHHQRSFPPLYPIVLAIGHLLFGQSMNANFIMTSLIGVMCALPIFWIGRELTDNVLALIAATLTILSPTLIHMSTVGMSEPLFCLLSLFMFYYFYCWLENKNDHYLIAAGVFTGLSYLCRANGLANFAAIFFCLIFCRTKLKHLFLFVSVTLLTILPWLIRNYLVFGDAFYYVGRFSTLVMPGTTPYGGLQNNSEFLSSNLTVFPFKVIISHFFDVFVIRIRMLIKETNVFLLLGLTGLFAGLNKRRVRTFFIFYLFFNFGITMLTPYLKPRHLISVFPLLPLLSMVLIKRFAADAFSLRQYWRNWSWSKVLLVLSAGGAIWLVYQVHLVELPGERVSASYQIIGEWFKTHTPPTGNSDDFKGLSYRICNPKSSYYLSPGSHPGPG